MAKQPAAETGGKCPGCKKGTLVKHKMTKLECSDCGWESILDPNQSNTFKPPKDSILLELACLLIVLLSILFLLYSDKSP